MDTSATRNDAETLELLSARMQALSDENRLRIINLLAARTELCVCDIQSVLNMTQTKVSRHLTILKNAGLVTSRRDGRWMYYALRRENPFTAALCNLCGTVFEAIPQMTSDLASLDTASGLVCCTIPEAL